MAASGRPTAWAHSLRDPSGFRFDVISSLVYCFELIRFTEPAHSGSPMRPEATHGFPITYQERVRQAG